MLNFTSNITEVISAQEKTSRTSAFVNYPSKKTLFEAGVVTDAQKKHFTELKGACGFSMHKDGRYLVTYTWHTATKKLDYLVVDLQTMQCAPFDKIKDAKKAVVEQVAEDAKKLATAEAKNEDSTDTKKAK